jgi:hypothetical protein
VQPAALAVVVAEDGQLPGLGDGLVADLLFPAGNEVEDELGTRVVATTMNTGA